MTKFGQKACRLSILRFAHLDELELQDWHVVYIKDSRFYVLVHPDALVYAALELVEGRLVDLGRIYTGETIDEREWAILVPEGIPAAVAASAPLPDLTPHVHYDRDPALEKLRLSGILEAERLYHPRVIIERGDDFIVEDLRSSSYYFIRALPPKGWELVQIINLGRKLKRPELLELLQIK